MKNKLSRAILFAAILLSLSFLSASALYSNVGDKSMSVEMFSDKYFANVHRSMDLHAQVMSAFSTETFTTDGQSRTEFGHDFAGAWLDNQGFLNIGIASNNSQVRSLQADSNSTWDFQ